MKIFIVVFTMLLVALGSIWFSAWTFNPANEVEWMRTASILQAMIIVVVSTATGIVTVARGLEV